MLLTVLIFLIVLALVCWIIQLLPIPAGRFPIKTILYIVVAVIAVVYLLRLAGIHI